MKEEVLPPIANLEGVAQRSGRGIAALVPRPAAALRLVDLSRSGGTVHVSNFGRLAGAVTTGRGLVACSESESQMLEMARRRPF
jgi:hypothetical protein